jgi:hypothetical protein
MGGREVITPKLKNIITKLKNIDTADIISLIFLIQLLSVIMLSLCWSK